VRRRAASFKQARCTAKQSSGTNGENAARARGLLLYPGDYLLVLHQSFLSGPSRNVQNIERRCLGERRVSIALAVARYLVVFMKRPGGQAQFSTALSLQAADDKFGALHEWINKHLDADLPLTVLADQAGMSERSFSRHYAEATGLTPARAIERLRVEAARRLLSESGLPVKRISRRCGFGSEETMRRSFLRLLAVTPQQYRTRFSA
jgi:transcriptional regulator GlxA family with amidase domain